MYGSAYSGYYNTYPAYGSYYGNVKLQLTHLPIQQGILLQGVQQAILSLLLPLLEVPSSVVYSLPSSSNHLLLIILLQPVSKKKRILNVDLSFYAHC